MPTIRGRAKSRMLVTPRMYSTATMMKVVREVKILLDMVLVILLFIVSFRSSLWVMVPMFSRIRSKMTMVALME